MKFVVLSEKGRKQTKGILLARFQNPATGLRSYVRKLLGGTVWSLPEIMKQTENGRGSGYALYCRLRGTRSPTRNYSLKCPLYDEITIGRHRYFLEHLGWATANPDVACVIATACVFGDFPHGTVPGEHAIIFIPDCYDPDRFPKAYRQYLRMAGCKYEEGVFVPVNRFGNQSVDRRFKS